MTRSPLPDSPIADNDAVLSLVYILPTDYIFNDMVFINKNAL